MDRYRNMLPLKIFHNEEKGFILLGMLFMMILIAAAAIGMNRRAGMQAKMAANQIHAVQTNFGRLAAIEHAAWQLINNPSWRTDPAGEDYVYNGITYTRKVLDSSIEGYTDAITITVTSPGGVKSASTSFRVTASQENFYLFADTLNHCIRKVDGSGTITTIAGTGTSGYDGDGGPATSAELYQPRGLHMDASGNIYIAEDTQRIRKVDTSGIITTIAGTPGISGYSGDGGPATSAKLDGPKDVFVDSSGNIYIADKNNYCIRKVDPSGIITTVAGIGGESGWSGNGGPATEAELNMPTGVWVDTSGNIYIADSLNDCVRKVDPSGIITTFAGQLRKGGYTGDDGPATSAKLDGPQDLYMDASGNIFIVDQLNHCVRKVDTSGIINTIAGTGSSGYSGDGGPATSATLCFPIGVWGDASGNILIGDSLNDVIRKVDTSGIITTIAGTGIGGYSGDGGPATSANINGPHGIVGFAPPLQKKYYLIADIHNEVIRKVNGYTGIITTIAGTPGSSGYSGDDGPATSAQLNWPETVSIDSSENIYISDSGNYCIRKVDGTTGTITTIAGNGTYGYSGDGDQATSAQLKQPYGVAVDGSGNVFIADANSHIIRKVDAVTQEITTVAGTPESSGYSGDDDQATSALLYYPWSVAVDGSGNIYIADTYNHIIRKVDGAGDITTVAGTPEASGYSGDDDQATSAQLNYPSGVAVDGSGNIYIADNGNYVIRKVDAAGDITTVAGTGISDYTGDGGQATSADLKYPYAVHVDASGNIFISEWDDHAIRRVDTGGIITTVAGTPGSYGFSGDSGPAASALLYRPGGVYWFEEASTPPPSSSSLEKVTEMY